MRQPRAFELLASSASRNAFNVERTVAELIDAGAAGCFLEDQVWPKRCDKQWRTLWFVLCKELSNRLCEEQWREL